ncbi:MAG: hypothetical protein IT310_15340 [Anaerolineales bacterium]|nr:hypothetical protein [Anaerolineales bacterium]
MNNSHIVFIFWTLSRFFGDEVPAIFDPLNACRYYKLHADDQLSYIEAFCAKIRKGLNQADFNTKRQIIELLDIRGKIAFENDEKVLYLKCLFQPNEGQLRLPIVTLPLSNSHEVNPIELTARLVMGQGLTLADILFSNAIKLNQSV